MNSCRHTVRALGYRAR